MSGYGFWPVAAQALPDYRPYPEPEEHKEALLKDFMGDGHVILPAPSAGVNIWSSPGHRRSAKAEKILKKARTKAQVPFWATTAMREVARVSIAARRGTREDPVSGRPRCCWVNAGGLGKAQ